MPSTRSATRSNSRPSLRRSGSGPAAWFRIAREERLLTGAVIVQVMALTLLGGGVTQLTGTVGIAVTTVALLVIGLLNDIGATFMRASLLVRVVLVGLVVLPLLQLVPLPPSIWHQLPGQALRVSAFTLVGIADRWQPLSLTPLNTNYTVIMAISFVTLTLALMTISRLALLVVIRVAVALIMLGLLIGVAQVASGGAALRIYDKADHGALLGFFTNKNHMALMLAASLPLVALLVGGYGEPGGRARAGTRGRRRRTVPWLLIGYWAVVVVAIVMTNSRAGVMLGLVATSAIAARALRDQPKHYLIGGPIVLLGLAAFVLSLPQIDAVFRRFNSVGDDLRWRFAQQSVPLVREYWLLGSGSGSYSRLYAVNEQLGWVKPTFVNHLHDDYYQVAIEQGTAGMLLLLLFALALMVCAVKAWRDRAEDRDAIFGAGTIVLLFALHSVVDYPLRRPATFPVLAIALALIWWRNERSREDMAA